MKELTTIQKEFLTILESFMHDKEYHLPADFTEVQELYKMAGEHNMSAAVYELIHSEAIWKKEEYAKLSAAWQRRAIMDVILQMGRAEGFLLVYKELCEAGLKPLIVKGLVCRNLYSKPEHRISGDEDVLISKKDFEACDKILLKNGMVREDFDMEADQLPYEIPYTNPKNGVYIELHFSLFPEESGAYGHLANEFQNVHETCICEEVKKTTVWTLCPTDHLFYLICHSFKHFLHSGFGMRQVCDMVMMAEHYGSQIDWKVIQEKLVRLNMESYWQALVEIGVAYLGFSLEKAGYPEAMRKRDVDYGPLLADLLESGIYGDSTMERKHSSNMTLAAMESGKKDTVASLKSSLFPSVDYMKNQFPWLAKYVWLLPVAYGIRIVRYLKSSKKEAAGSNSVKIGAERVDLLRKYKIIK